MKKLFKKIFNNKNHIVLNSIFFTLLFMILYVVVLTPVILYFLIQNPNIFHEAETDIYTNASEIYRIASQVDLYSEFFIWGSCAELFRRCISLKVALWNDQVFMSYACICIGVFARILSMFLMMNY